jgi:chromosome segregation ATPase
MNLQNVADFLDLVTNPEKYQAVLVRLQEEQARLNAAIETVGKASELDKLRKDVEKKAAKNESDFVEKVTAAEQRLEQRFEIAASAQTTADKIKEEAEKMLAEAQRINNDAIVLKNSFEGRDKALRQAEEMLARRQAKLDGLVEEYNAKLAKLRSVMV